ncbi:MAG TPA: rhodanese-like domain-containing protein [bacterium]|nr:rhodanese-like domain-containing protein [bacterium]
MNSKLLKDVFKKLFPIKADDFDSQENSPKTISPGEAADMIKKGAAVIDVREPAELAGPLKPIIGATNIPMKNIVGRMKGEDRDKNYILVCAHGNRSRMASSILAQLGFKNVFNLSGGMKAYRNKYPD